MIGTQYKDACNAKSNQQNLGTIRSSNLCTEIIQYTSPEEVGFGSRLSAGMNGSMWIARLSVFTT